MTERRWLIASAAVVALVITGAGIVAATVRHSNRSAVSGATLLSRTTPLPPLVTTGPFPARIVAKPTAGKKPSATHKAKAKPKPKAKPKAKPTPTKSKAPTTGPVGNSTGGSSSSGVGRIQYGKTYTGDGTFYGATGAGNCSYEASSDLMVGAMNQTDYDNSQACGAFLAVTGPNGNTITIKVVDRCPECAPGAIDLSQQAFVKLAPASAGRIRISWHLLSPAISGPVSYKYKSGSTKYWCGIQVRNHRNPVHSLSVKVNGSWKSLPRFDYNYFISADGSGCGSDIRITDIYGHQLTDSGISVSPDVVQKGHGQFAAR